MQSKIIGAVIVMLSLCTSACAADDDGFARWLADVRREAKTQGISESVLSEALDAVFHDESIIALDRKQPESTLTYAQYHKKVLTDRRIKDGRAHYREYEELLEKTARHYAVDSQVIVALWGIETSYGEITGGFDVIEALATLAYDGRRSEFFRKELFNALHILEQGHIAPGAMYGSWAGAMGQCQFMPSSFLRFAADGDGDGHKDIWNTMPDVFASIANYLSQEGWVYSQPIAVAANVEKSLPESAYDIKQTMSLNHWRAKGVTPASGELDGELQASLVRVGDDADAPRYLVFNNYKVLLKWNRSRYFATTVGLLAEAIAKEK